MKKQMTAFALCALLVGCNTTPATTPTPETSEAPAQESTAAAAPTYDKIVVGLDDTFAPMGFRDDNGELVGFDVELAKAVGEKLGIEVEFQPIDWAMKETELNEGNIDCIWNGYSITDERKTQVLFSNPYLDNRQIIIVLADSTVETKADLSGLTVAVQKESSALDAVNAEADFTTALKDGAPVEFDTNIDCFLDLEAGRADAIVVDEVLARYVMKQRGQEQYRVLDEDFGSEQYGIGFRLTDTDLVDQVNKAMEELKADGTYESIYATWFSEN